jgi:SAM-dependent methyltransferase
MSNPLAISYRRRRLDRDMASITFPGLTIDLGGERIGRRGTFQTPANWICVNLDGASRPELMSDAARVGLVDGCADVVVCTEILEHVPYPERVLNEAYRMLKYGGWLVLSMPFMIEIHDDPGDYQRYTASKLEWLLRETGFREMNVIPQGYYFSLVSDLIRAGLVRLRVRMVRWVLSLVAMPLLNWLVSRDRLVSGFARSYVTGYFVTARK